MINVHPQNKILHTYQNGAGLGYLHEAYAASLEYAGSPIKLRRSNGWLLKRPISGTVYYDAIGCYPLLCCTNWSTLAGDLVDLDPELVSITVVADPFGNHGGVSELSKAFPNMVRPFKEHYMVDLRQLPCHFVSPQHRRYARRALAVLRVENVGEPYTFLDDWNQLYSMLIKRHGIAGIARFSREAFQQQLTIPGITVLRAVHGNETVGMTLWYQQEDRAYYHLGAYNEKGYTHSASYAIFSTALNFFAAQGLTSLALGAGAGPKDEDDGLTRFKRGWATGTRTAHLCGRICNHELYAKIVVNNSLCRSSGVHTREYFPAYRAGDVKHIGESQHGRLA